MGWSDLPCDLVISIAARLWEAGDYLRFRAVCRSWKSAVGGFRPSFFPWIAVIPHFRTRLSYISHVANDRVYERPLPCSSVQFHSSLISNNKDGWMMFLPIGGVPVIFNPFTGAQLHHLLPSLYTCVRRVGDVFLTDNLFIFSVHHADYNGHLVLAAASLGDDAWSVTNLSLRYDFHSIRCIVFHAADDKFYAMDRNGNLLAFCLVHCGGETVVVGQVSTPSNARKYFHWSRGPHLVSCGSNLLQVGSFPWKEFEFEILKYCPDADTWIRMTDIGNNSLFLDSCGAKLLPIPQGEERRLRRNCIYFIQEEIEHIYSACVRIYDVSKGIADPCFSMDIKSDFQFLSPLMWFTPSISINN